MIKPWIAICSPRVFDLPTSLYNEVKRFFQNTNLALQRQHFSSNLLACKIDLLLRQMIQLELIRPNIKMSSNTSKNLKTPGIYPKLAFCDELQPESPKKLESSERYEIIPIRNQLWYLQSIALEVLTLTFTFLSLEFTFYN